MVGLRPTLQPELPRVVWMEFVYATPAVQSPIPLSRQTIPAVYLVGGEHALLLEVWVRFANPQRALPRGGSSTSA